MGATPGNTTETLISLGWAFSGIKIDLEAGLIWVPWLNVITIALDILELAGVIPDPITELLSLFAGRPKEEATIQQAQRLLNAQNPAARLFGIALERLVKEFDIVTSTGGSGRALLDVFTKQFTDNLKAQGVSDSRAFQILENAISEAAQKGLELEPELKKQLDQSLNFNGDQHTSDNLIKQYNRAIKSGKNCKDALKAAEAWVWKNEPLAYVGKMRIGPFITQTPPADPVLPGPDCTCPNGYTIDPTTELCHPTQTQQCPPGEVWDPVTQSCVPANPPPPPVCPPGTVWDPGSQSCIPVQSTGNQPDPQGDEITFTLCNQMQGAAANIVAAVNALTQLITSATSGSGNGSSSDCCDQIVSNMSSIITVLGTIAGNIPAAGGGVDVGPIVTALDNLVAAISALAPGAGPDLAPIVDQLAAIAKAIASGSPTDVSGIVAELKKFNATYDVHQPVIDALVAQGWIGSKTAQLFAGMAPPDADFASRHTIWHDRLRGFILGTCGYDIDTGTDLNPTAGDAAKWIASGIKTGLSMTDKVILPVIQPFIDVVKSQIAPASVPGVGGSGVDLDTPVASALSVTASAAILGYLMSFTGIDAGEPLAHISEIIAGAIGWEQLRDVQIGPLVREGLEQIAVQQARKLFQQNLPGASSAANWLARGLIDAGTADELEALNGLHHTLRPAFNKAAGHGWSPRQLIRAIETGYFSDTDVADELTFSGMRPVSQHRFLLAAPYLATASQRSKLEGAIEAAYEAGLMSDADFTSNIDSAEHNTDRNNLLLTAMHWKLLVAETKMLEKEYTDLFIGGVSDDATFRADLATIGLQPGYIDIVAGVAEARANVTMQKKNLRDAAALARSTAAEERKAALQSFKSGSTTEAALAAALLLTGLTPTQVAAQTTLASLQQTGSLRWIYGVLKSPAEAALLRERVAALTDQRKRLQIDDLTYLNSLQALGIPPRVVNALNAAANSLITPKASAVVTPVSTT